MTPRLIELKCPQVLRSITRLRIDCDHRGMILEEDIDYHERMNRYSEREF